MPGKHYGKASGGKKAGGGNYRGPKPRGAGAAKKGFGAAMKGKKG